MVLSDVHVQVQVQCCFTSTETVRTIKDGEPRTATSTFTQLLNSDVTSTETIRLIRDGKDSVSDDSVCLECE